MGRRNRMRPVGWFLIALPLIAGTAPAQPEHHAILGVGYMSVLGGADVARDRDAGWDFYGGFRRVLNERITVGISGELGLNKLNASEFFRSRDITPDDPEAIVRGGDMQVFGVTADFIWQHELDRTTVGYVKGGLGYYRWSVDDIFVDVGALSSGGATPDIDPVISFADDSGPAMYAGAGVRFPLGESAGLWGEFVVTAINVGSEWMTLVPLRAGISLP